MGRPKALLPVPPDDTPLLAHVVARLRGIVAEEIVVVANDPGLADALRLGDSVTWVRDAWPDTGTLGGIATGLQQVTDWGLIVACDLPLVSARLCEHLIALATGGGAREGVAEGATEIERFDVVVPVIDGYEEPLHALYHRRCLPWIEARLARGERRVISFFPDVRVRRVEEAELRQHDPNLHSFVNVNTPEEWEAALALLAAEGL